MTYRDRPELGRPWWMAPVLMFWLAIGLPGYVLGLLYRGTVNPLPDVPEPNLVGLLLWLVLISFIFVSPVALLLAERRYRRTLRNGRNA